MTTPMGTCCDSPCHHCPYFINECPKCHTAPPTDKQMTPPLPDTHPSRSPLPDTAPTPNTGTEWDKDYGTRFEWRHDPTGAGYIWDNLGQQVWDEVLMKLYIERLLATQKSQLLAEVEGMIEQTKLQAVSENIGRGISVWNEALDRLKAKLKGM